MDQHKTIKEIVDIHKFRNEIKQRIGFYKISRAIYSTNRVILLNNARIIIIEKQRIRIA
jgi:hypothetical protein